MKLNTKEYTFKDGKAIVISQESWDVSMTLSEEQRKAVDSPLDDKRMQFFREKIYPVLFAPASGDVPSMEESYAMLETNPADLDGWYKTCQIINPTWFTHTRHNESEEVVFSDGSTVTVNDGNVPSAIMRIRDLEEYAGEHPAENLIGQVFRSTFYPKLAACSSGDVPDEDTARKMPTVETNKWYEAVNRVNPQWFQSLHDLKDQVDAEQIKKKRKRPRK